MQKAETDKPIAKNEEGNYIAGYSSRVMKILDKRSATRDAAFFLPYLQSGMDLLDCGCGPGAIAINLAKIVAPGKVLGIDIEDNQFEIGRASALEQGVSNVSFETNNIYNLPYPDASFDAVFAHAVLYHLNDPRQALSELYRVLKPRGVIGIRDSDGRGNILAPSTPLLDKATSLLWQVLEYKGGNPFFGREQRPFLRQAGFVDIQVSASYDYYGTPAENENWGLFFADLILQPHITQIVLDQKWATQADLEAMSAAYKVWGEHPDAFYCRARCEAVAFR